MNKLIYIVIILSIGCSSKVNEPLPSPVFWNSFEYFPIENNNRQWVYEVRAISKNGVTHYLNDDTLSVIGDTNILAPQSTLNFKYLAFKKMNEEFGLVAGIYPMEDQAMLIMLRNQKNNVQNYRLFDLSRIIDGGQPNTITMDGAPFDLRYRVGFRTQFIECNTHLGVKKGIASSVSFQETVGGGKINKLRTYQFAKDIGIFYMDFNYNRSGVAGLADSICFYSYRLKKVIE